MGGTCKNSEGGRLLLRIPLLSDDLQQLGVALCTSGWKWEGGGGGCLIPLQGCQLQGMARSEPGGFPKPLTPLGRVPLIHTLQIPQFECDIHLFSCQDPNTPL